MIKLHKGKKLHAALIFIILLFSMENFLISKGLIRTVIFDPDNYTDSPCDLHPYLCWRLHPGNHISLEDPNVIETVWPNRCRASRKNMNHHKARRIAVAGCSYTYGIGVKDNETFTWLLGERFPNTSFDNFGVPGYGTVQCLLNIKQQLERGNKYDLIIYAPIEKHIERNNLRQCLFPYKNNTFFFMTPVYADKRNGKITFHSTEELKWPFEDTWLTIYFFKHMYLYQKIFFSAKEYKKFFDETVQNILEVTSFSYSYTDIANTSNRQEDTLFFYEMTKLFSEMTNSYNIPLVVFVLNSEIGDLYNDDIIKEHKDLYPNLCFRCIYPEQHLPSSRIGGALDHHPNAATHKFWAKNIGDILEAHNLAR